jgi:hypothetical protein
VTGHRGKGIGGGPGQGPSNGNPGKLLDTSPEKQRARALKRWADHRERVAQGKEAVESHRRVVALKRARLELVRLKRSMCAASMPPRACSEGKGK